MHLKPQFPFKKSKSLNREESPHEMASIKYESNLSETSQIIEPESSACSQKKQSVKLVHFKMQNSLKPVKLNNMK